jgi:hypothetical protein
MKTDMVLGNIDEGRRRSNEILNILNPEDAEFLYGEMHGGIGYCPFSFVENGNNYVASVRTASRKFVKIDSRMLKTNVAAAESREMEHVLILGFNWHLPEERKIFILNDCMKYVHHVTKGKNYYVFKVEHIEELFNAGDINVRKQSA